MADSLRTPLNPALPRKLASQVAVATAGRLLLNTAKRFAYPFAPALSRGLGVQLPAITFIIALNQLSGLLSPFFGPLSDRWGYRVMMLAGLGLCAGGLLAGGAIPLYSMIMLAFLLAGLGKSIFDPALQAYVGERVPYQRRGMVIGLIELSWSGASLIGIPLVGLLIDRFGWRTPFFVIGGLLLLVTALLGLLLPRQVRTGSTPAPTAQFYRSWQLLLKNRAALGLLVFGFCSSMANDTLFVVYGAWLEDSFNLGLVALGTATIIIGLAELAGELLTATIADRVGLKRSVTIGALLTVISYAALPLMGQTLPLALTGLFIVFITFEFMVVTNISLVTEVVPGARATMLSAMIAITGLGRVAGALLGGMIWVWGHLPAIGFAAALLSALAFAFFWWGLRYWQVEERLHN